jgi:hypothetical protein
MRKNKIFMFLCIACIPECLTRQRSPLQPCTFSTAELACACAQLVVVGTELTRAAERALRSRAACSGRPKMHELGRAALAFPAHLRSRLLRFVLVFFSRFTRVETQTFNVRTLTLRFFS